MMLRYDGTVHAGAFRSTNQCAEILRIFNFIEDQYEGGFAALLRDVENVLDLDVALCPDDCDDSLCRSIADEVAELLLPDFDDRHPVAFCHLLDFFNDSTLDT